MVIRYDCKLVRLGWKIWTAVVLLAIAANVLGSWAYERSLAPEFKVIRDTCPLGLSGQELRGIRGMMPRLWES